MNYTPLRQRQPRPGIPQPLSQFLLRLARAARRDHCRPALLFRCGPLIQPFCNFLQGPCAPPPSPFDEACDNFAGFWRWLCHLKFSGPLAQFYSVVCLLLYDALGGDVGSTRNLEFRFACADRHAANIEEDQRNPESLTDSVNWLSLRMRRKMTMWGWV